MVTVRNRVKEGTRRFFDWYLLQMCARIFMRVKLLPHPKWVRDDAIRALRFARDAHKGQRRPGGEPQFAHVCLVALDAAREAKQLRLNATQARDLVVAAILHDVIEDTDWDHYDLSVFFGQSVADIVRAVSHKAEEEPDVVYLRRVASGGRLAVIVKRSDRLVNLNTLRHAPLEFRKRKLAEIRAALPLWREIDPDGAPLIEGLLQEVEQNATAC